ncbi:hypothetical protein EPR50_G00149710 [Perca flavescens]|uniref:Uncharacterized protein n=1 Tax=Perca flavescens TaxID=8167 RepID=A0A484CJT8_PERFV|nr:hypothetical protein EPR50_G00149710 [Perca flavescens]
MQRWVGQLLGLFCINWACSLMKQNTSHTVTKEEKEELCTPGALKTNSSTLSNRHLSESEMATFVSMATCHTCNKTSRHKGMNRDFLATLAKTHSTPGSAAKHKTPQSTHRANTPTPKTPGKDKTPAHTPRSSTSSNTPGSGSSSSKPPSKPKNWVVQRLSKILMREDNQGSKKGGLKDFLSSL